MKFPRLIYLIALILIPLIGCAEEIASVNSVKKEGSNIEGVYGTELQTDLKQGGDILSIKKNVSGGIKASYFFNLPPARDELAIRIIEMMVAIDVDKEFIQRVSARLQKNRMLNKESFSLPLTDVDGTVYQFDFISDIENSFFVLNYSSN